MQRAIAAALVMGLAGTAHAQTGGVALPDARAFPESVTVTGSGAVIASSYSLGTLYRAAPGAAMAAAWIVTAASGLTSASGVLADEANHRLWVCGTASGGAAVLATFDLDTGAPGMRYPLPGGGHCNDVTIAPGGGVFATDTAKGRILKLVGNALTVWSIGPKLAGADGIVLSPGGGAFIVSSLADRLVSVAIKPDGSAGLISDLVPSAPLHSPDGLHPGRGDTLLLAEAGAGRVDEITVTGNRVSVVPFKTGLKNPTAAVLGAGNAYIVDSNLPLRVPANLQKNAGPFVISVVPVPSR